MIRLTACILCVLATTISTLRAADPPIISPFGSDEYYNGTGFQLPEPPPIITDHYVILTADITTASEGTVSDEWEIPYDISSPTLDFEFTNEWSEPLTLSNIEFQLSPTEIPLDSLNSDFDVPYVGFPDSIPLGVGASTADVPLDLPEPASVWLFALGGVVLGIVGVRRRLFV